MSMLIKYIYPIICINSMTANIGVLYVKNISNTKQIIAVKIRMLSSLSPINIDFALDFIIFVTEELLFIQVEM